MDRTKPARTAATAVYESLREAILCGELTPGQKLGIDAVRERFGAGATPVREALNRLVSEGLVVSRDLRGFSVADLDEAELVDLYKARGKFLPFLIREVIKNGDDAWEEGVVLAFHRLAKTPWSTNDDQFQLNPEFRGRLLEFYTALYSGCGSRHLVDFAIRLHHESNRFLWLIMKFKFETNEPESMRKRLVDAVLARDVEKAVETLTIFNEKLSQTVLKGRAAALAEQAQKGIALKPRDK